MDGTIRRFRDHDSEQRVKIRTSTDIRSSEYYGRYEHIQT